MVVSGLHSKGVITRAARTLESLEFTQELFPYIPLVKAILKARQESVGGDTDFTS